MNGNNFTALQLEQLKTNANSIFTDIVACLNAIKSECNTVSGIVMSEDSQLASRWTQIASSMTNPIANISETFKIVADLLSKYVQETVQNENKASTELNEIDGSIAELGTIASGLVGGLGAIQGVQGISASNSAAGLKQEVTEVPHDPTRDRLATPHIPSPVGPGSPIENTAALVGNTVGTTDNIMHGAANVAGRAVGTAENVITNVFSAVTPGDPTAIANGVGAVKPEIPQKLGQ